MSEYKLINVSNLTMFNRRDIRTDVLAILRDRIEDEFNPAKPLTVVEEDGNYLVADGNHRLEVLRDLGINQVPCIVREGNKYAISVKCNLDEDTFAPEDLFDRLDTIRSMKDEGYTQKEIGKLIGMSRGSVSQFILMQDKIATDILDLCKSHQKGRVAEDATNVTFNFTEGWFRTSGLYDINDKYQSRLMEAFINDKCNWAKSKLQSESEKYKSWMNMIEYAKENLHDSDDLPDITKMIENGVFHNLSQLKNKVDDFNKKAKDKLIQGNAITELKNLENGTIDVVITDPPYGMNYKSNRSKFNNHVTKEGVKNDGDEAIELFSDVCSVLSEKTKEDAHLYFFINWDNYSKFRDIASKFFNVKTTLVWNKGNKGAGDLENDWGNATELIIYCTKGKKGLNKRRDNVLEFSKLSSSKMTHPTQKPIDLISEILSVSANKNDMFCDPFMGSGSHIIAAKLANCNYIGIELDKTIFEKAKSWIDE